MKISESARALILRQFQANAAESIRTILQETSLPSRRLAVETIEFPFDLTLELAEKFNLSICLDTGHVLVGFSGPIGLSEAVEKCSPRLAEIHLHDGPWQGPEHTLGYGLDHQALGKGDLEIKRFFQSLESFGFNGPIIFELSLEDAQASMRALRAVLPAV
jgi:sugar phosphate isomerase/epimerase